jgi:hypothetical protein
MQKLCFKFIVWLICLVYIRAPATVHDQYESPTVGDQKILIFFFLKKTKHNVLINII